MTERYIHILAIWFFLYGCVYCTSLVLDIDGKTSLFVYIVVAFAAGMLI